FFMPRPPPSSTLFPYTTLFRSALRVGQRLDVVLRPDEVELTTDGALRVGEAEEQGPGQRDGQQQRGERHGRTGEQPLAVPVGPRSEEHTSELQSRENLVCRLLL